MLGRAWVAGAGPCLGSAAVQPVAGSARHTVPAAAAAAAAWTDTLALSVRPLSAPFLPCLALLVQIRGDALAFYAEPGADLGEWEWQQVGLTSFAASCKLTLCRAAAGRRAHLGVRTRQGSSTCAKDASATRWPFLSTHSSALCCRSTMQFTTK